MRFPLSLVATAATLALSVAAAGVPVSGTLAGQAKSDEPLMGAGSRQLPSPNSEDQGGTGVKGSAQSEGATNKDTAPRDTAVRGRETIIIAPERRTMMRDYVLRQNIRPRHFNERVIVGTTLPSDVELAPVPEAWGPELRTYRYVYGDDRIFFVDPSSRRVVQVIE
jgi:Protein of unknown function (DUF1236)